MKTTEFKGNEIDDINSSTDIFDALDPVIKKKVKEARTFQKILLLTRKFMEKNDYALSTNIVGRRVLVNQQMEDDIFDAFGLDKLEVKKIILNSTYFKKTFGRELQLTDQFCLAFPLIIASLEYKWLKKQSESDLCYLLAHFKPYSSRESVFFKFGVNEDQMLYTIEKSLSERFDIKKYGTIINVLTKRSKSSYLNYIADMKEGEKLTDKKIYVAYTSGIAGAVNTFIGGIVEEYRKNEGKKLGFEAGVSGVFDKDTDEIEYSDADIQSDVAIKTNIIRRTLLALTQQPINKKLISIACQTGFHSSSSMYTTILTNTVDEIVDKMFPDLEQFFSSLISSFLFNNKPGGGKYTMDDFKTPVFLNVGIDILAGKKPNISDVNLIKCREIMSKMCENYCEKFNPANPWGDTKKREFKLALAAYWIYLIRETNK